METLEHQAIDILHALRERVAERLERLDQALALVDGLDAGTMRRHGPSIRTRVIDLLEESPRIWSVADIVSEFESRGLPLQAKDATGAVRRTLTALTSGGLVRRAAIGRFVAAKFPETAVATSEVEAVADQSIGDLV